MTRHLTFLHGLHKNMSMCSLDLSRVYGFKPCIFVRPNFLRYEKTHNVKIPNLRPRTVKICRNPTLAKCGGEAQHLEKLEVWSPLGLSNVQSSTARPKTPCIEFFWCHWKGLET